MPRNMVFIYLTPIKSQAIPTLIRNNYPGVFQLGNMVGIYPSIYFV